MIGKIYVHKRDGQRAKLLNKWNLMFLPQETIYSIASLWNNKGYWISEEEYIIGKVLNKYK